jgi:ribonuclease HII
MSRKNRNSQQSSKQSHLFPHNKKAGYKKSAFLFLPDFQIEQELLSEGYRFIAGIDEAGRGALAGPLSVGIVIFSCKTILDPPEEIEGRVNDSKKLTPLKRESLSEIIRSHSIHSDSCLIPVEIIDELNINGATEYGVRELLDKAEVKPDIVIMDGNFNFKQKIPLIPVKGGDTKSLSIAAASILAKVERDRYMKSLHNEFPEYCFHENKGYGTSGHRKAIQEYGYRSVHRKSFAPVKHMIGRERSLFSEV